MNGTFLIRTIWPSESVSPKRLSVVVWPSSATLVAPSSSSGLIERPSATGHSRASR